MKEEFYLKDILTLFRRNWKMIFLVMLITLTGTAFITFIVQTPKYEAVTQILVNKESADEQGYAQLQNTQADLQLINTYKVIIKSPVILNEVINKLDLDMKASELTKLINVNNQENSKVMTVQVETDDPKESVDIANALSTTFNKEIQKMMKVDNVRVLMEANLSDTLDPVKPRIKINFAVGILFGIFLSIIIVLITHYTDKRFKDEKELEEELQIPVLGVVKKFNK